MSIKKALNKDTVRAVVYGHAVGDALGVPVEFQSRESLKVNPVTDMRGYGTYNVPTGSWSDDTSMTLALMNSLGRKQGIDYDDIMQQFIAWVDKACYTPGGKLFDIGNATRQALMKYHHGSQPLSCGGKSPYDNGNGSLMRIAPIVLFLYAANQGRLEAGELERIHQASSLTHDHARSKLACGVYALIMQELLQGKQLEQAVRNGIAKAKEYYSAQPEYSEEIMTYERLWNIDEFCQLPKAEIKSSGYVVDTLEAVIWCLLNTHSYAECVLRAVNLGEDTDTVGAIAGGLAGACYGYEDIPAHWIDALLNKQCIDENIECFVEALS